MGEAGVGGSPGQVQSGELFDAVTEQGRRWHALDLGATRCHDVERILTLADELRTWTIEALMAKSDEQVGLETLLRPHRQP